jgi:hypothetical protein
MLLDLGRWRGTSAVTASMPSSVAMPTSSTRQLWRMPRLRASCAVACRGTNLTLTAEGRAAKEARAYGTFAPLLGLCLKCLQLASTYLEPDEWALCNSDNSPVH